MQSAARRTFVLGTLAFCGLAVAPALADPISVTISGNFGAPKPGSSVFDNQDYTINYLIPDPALPSVTTCCDGQISATYDVTAQLDVPGIGLTVDDPIQVIYNSQAPFGQWLFIFAFRGLPQGDFMLWLVQINSGDLWNGLAGSLGTPVINLLNNAPGTGGSALEQNSPIGDIPIAGYGGAVTITATSVPEPAGAWLLGIGLLALGFFRQKWTGNCPR
jgi:hypothetical protein